MKPKWSERGEAPTQEESELVQALAVERIENALDRWIELARAVGLPALCALLDEFGGEKIHVPSRGALLESLWSRHLQAEIRRLLAGGRSERQVAKLLGVSTWAVRRAAGYRRPRKCVQNGRRTRADLIHGPR